MRFLLTLLGLIAFVHGIHAQACNITLRGSITDINTGTALAFASVLLQGAERGVASDNQGRFELDKLCSGTYTIMISHIGCAPYTQLLTLQRDTILTIVLDHSDIELHEFELVESAPYNAMLTRIEVGKSQLEVTSGKQIAELASLIPGMRLSTTGSNIAKPVFKGLSGNRVMVLTNGIRQEGQYWGGEHAPEIDSYIASSLAVVEGVDALRYAPDAIGGIILVEPPSVFGESKKLAGEAQTALQSNGMGGSAAASLSGKPFINHHLYYRLQGSVKGLGDIKTSEVWLTNTGIKEHNGSFALGYKFKKWEVETFLSIFNQEFGLYRYSHLGNLTDLYEVLLGRSQPDTLGFSRSINRPRQVVLHEVFKTSLKYEIDSRSKLEFTYARQYNRRSEYDVHVGFNPSPETLSRPQLEYGLTSHLSEAIWHYKLGHLSGNAGGTGLWRQNNFRGRNFMPSYKNSSVGFFATQTATFDAWKLNYGLRYDWYSAEIFEPVASTDNPLNLGFEGLAAAVALQRELPEGSIIISAASQWRNPAVNEMYSSGLHHGAGGIEEGNPNLRSERSYNLSAGVRQSWGGHQLHGIAYVNFINDFIYLDPTTIELTIRGAFPRYDYRQADALYTGFDLKYEGKWSSKWNGTASASLLWAENITKNAFFIGVPAHRFDAALSYQFNDMRKFKTPFVSINGSYTMRQYREPELFPFETVFGESPNTPLPVSFDFAPAPDAYFLLGASAGVRFAKSTLSVSVENALNTAYRDYMNRFRYFADEPGINFLIRFKQSF